MVVMRHVTSFDKDLDEAKVYERALASQLNGVVSEGKHPWDIEADGFTYEVKTEKYSWKPDGNMFFEMGDIYGTPPENLFDLIGTRFSTGPFRKLQDGIDFWLHGMRKGDAVWFCKFSVPDLCARILAVQTDVRSPVKAIRNTGRGTSYITCGYALPWERFTDLKLAWLKVD